MAATMTKWFTSKLGGAFNQNDSLDMLSNGATKLIEDALEGFETSEPIIDYNVAVVGTGTSGVGSYVHSSHQESVWKHPVANVKMKLLESACAIKDPNHWDANYTQRLMALKTMITKSHGAVWGRQCVYGLDQYHDRSGAPVPANTSTYVPNAYVYEMAQDHPAHYVPSVSIHPYRIDAVDELRKWIKRGVKVVKWIPSVQGIDPSNEKCDKFYGLMAQHGIILHSGGDRVLIDPPGYNASLENPLLLRRPLSFGVKVIISHCASEGKSHDLEFPPHALVDNLSLFFRMMEEPKYVGLLFGDISGICNFTRVECLLPLLDNTELHKRLVYGSNYPVTAINLVVQTYWFANKGLVSEKECDWIAEIYKINPLLFDFVMKRTLKSQKGNKFSISIFKEHPDLQISKIQLVDHLNDEDSSLPTELPPPKAPTPPPISQTSILTETESPLLPLPLTSPIKISPMIAPSPKFSITTPPSPAVRADPDRLAPSFHNSTNEDAEDEEEEEGYTEEEIEL